MFTIVKVNAKYHYFIDAFYDLKTAVFYALQMQKNNYFTCKITVKRPQKDDFSIEIATIEKEGEKK